MISIRTAGTYAATQNNPMKFTYNFHDTTELFCRADFNAIKYSSTDEIGSGPLTNPVPVPMSCFCGWNGKINIFLHQATSFNRYDIILCVISAPLVL